MDTVATGSTVSLSSSTQLIKTVFQELYQQICSATTLVTLRLVDVPKGSKSNTTAPGQLAYHALTLTNVPGSPKYAATMQTATISREDSNADVVKGSLETAENVCQLDAVQLPALLGAYVMTAAACPGASAHLAILGILHLASAQLIFQSKATKTQRRAT